MRIKTRALCFLLLALVLSGQTGSCTRADGPKIDREAVETGIEYYLPDLDRPRRLVLLPSLSVDGKADADALVIDALLREYVALATRLTNRLYVSGIVGDPLSTVRTEGESDIVREIRAILLDEDLRRQEKIKKLRAMLTAVEYDVALVVLVSRPDVEIIVRPVFLLTSMPDHLISETVRFPADAFSCKAGGTSNPTGLCPKHRAALEEFMDIRQRVWKSLDTVQPPWYPAIDRARMYIRANPLQ